MNTLATTLAHAGPGPWILLFPWSGPSSSPGSSPSPAAAVAPGTQPAARTATARRTSARRSPCSATASPCGEIDEDEYWRRLTVLEEQFGRAATKGRRA